jgi:hypothetical protein
MSVVFAAKPYRLIYREPSAVNTLFITVLGLKYTLLLPWCAVVLLGTMA